MLERLEGVKIGAGQNYSAGLLLVTNIDSLAPKYLVTLCWFPKSIDFLLTLAK